MMPNAKLRKRDQFRAFLRPKSSKEKEADSHTPATSASVTDASGANLLLASVVGVNETPTSPSTRAPLTQKFTPSTESSAAGNRPRGTFRDLATGSDSARRPVQLTATVTPKHANKPGHAEMRNEGEPSYPQPKYPSNTNPNTQAQVFQGRQTNMLGIGNSDTQRIYQDSKHFEFVGGEFHGGQTLVFSEYVSLQPARNDRFNIREVSTVKMD